MNKKRHGLFNSAAAGEIPLVCANEPAAVEFFERQRWGKNPCCVHCGSTDVYKMLHAKTGQRNERFLWRCRDCGKQYTVRIGTVYGESRIELRHWSYAFWRASTSKKGVSALEIKRHCQISYKSALFLMNRIRFAMAPDSDSPKHGGGNPCFRGISKRGRGTSKTPVFAAVERNGQIRRRVVADVTGGTLKEAIREEVDIQARLINDDFLAYKGIVSEYARGHDSVRHCTREYARGGIHTNTAESSFALVKRGIMGIYHNVSRKYPHRYLWRFDFIWNNRDMNDGERTVAAIQSAEGRRLMHGQPA